MNKYDKCIGILFAAAGIACLLFPVVASLWTDVLAGVAFMCAALFAAVKIADVRDWCDRLYWLLLCVLYAIAGYCLIVNPLVGADMLTAALGLLFVFEGVASLLYWVAMRHFFARSWVVLLNGVVGIALGGLMVLFMDAGLWFLGVMAGVDLLFTGFTLLAFPINGESRAA